MTNWRAMQVAGSLKAKGKQPAAPLEVRTRYMAMGSWRASLSDGGRRKA